MSIFSKLLGYLSTIIQFKDINVKEALLASSDINPDGTREITYTEAKSSSITPAMLKAALNPNENNTDIVSFEEFQYFTGISQFPSAFLKGCSNLKHIKFPLITISTTIIGNSIVGGNLLANTSVEVLDLTNVNKLFAHPAPVTGAVTGTTLFGSLSSLTTVIIPNLQTIQGNVFTKATAPNVTKVVISSINQWLGLAVDSYSNAKPNILPTASGKAYLYIGDVQVTDIDVNNASIPEHCFDGVLGLNTITIKNNNTSVGAFAFSNLPATVTIINYDYISSIGVGCFNNCKAQGITGIPANSINIGEGAFSGSSIQSCISDTLTTIGRVAFESSQVTVVKINNCNSISGSYGGWTHGTFASCSKLVSAEINASPSIPSSCFYNCSSLTILKAYSATIVGKNGCDRCTNLTTLYVNANITKFEDNACFNDASLDTIKTVDTSNNNAISNLDLSILSVVGVSAFEGCSLLQCPSVFPNLTSIGRCAFTGCIAPTTGTYVTLSKSDSIVTFVPSVNLSDNYKSPFPTSVTTVYVPSNLVSDYQSDDNWSRTGLTFAAIA